MTDLGRQWEKTRTPGPGEPDPDGIENNREWFVKQYQRPYADEITREWIARRMAAWWEAREEKR